MQDGHQSSCSSHKIDVESGLHRFATQDNEKLVKFLILWDSDVLLLAGLFGVKVQERGGDFWDPRTLR